MMVAKDPAYDAMRKAFARIKPPPVWTRQTAAYDPIPTIRQLHLQSFEQIADHFADRLLHRKLTSAQQTILIETVTPRGKSFNPDTAEAATQVRRMMNLMMSMPEYQLN